MKLLTTQIFQYSLLAPKGFKFKSDSLEDIAKNLTDDKEYSFMNNDTVFRWKELHVNIHFNSSPEYFDRFLNQYITQIDNTNHYNWLTKNMNDFLDKVLNREMVSEEGLALISAHAGKCYEYRDRWLSAQIPFYYGVAIYLLSYTPEFGENSRDNVCDWVIDNYKKYVHLLPKIETNQL
jgi:hypothetical protein